MSNGGKKQGEKSSSCPRVGYSQGKERGSIWFLKSPKDHPRIPPGGLVPKQKCILLWLERTNGYLQLYRASPRPPWLFCEEARKNDEVLCVRVCGLLHQGKEENEGNESEDIVLQTLTPVAELDVSATPAALLIHPPLPPPSLPSLPQFLTPGLRTSPPSRDRLENPVLVSGAQGLGLVLPSNTQQGSQFGPRATPRAGLSPWLSQVCVLRHFSCV